MPGKTLLTGAGEASVSVEKAKGGFIVRRSKTMRQGGDKPPKFETEVEVFKDDELPDDLKALVA